METSLEKSTALGNVVFEEKIITKSSGSGDQEMISHDFLQTNKGENQRHIKQEDDSSKPPSPNRKDISTILSIKEETYDQTESSKTKAKIGEVKEENEKLKKLLSQTMKDYQSLQMRFLDTLHHQQKQTNTAAPVPSQHQESDHLVSLSLGRSRSCDQPPRPNKEHQEKNMISNCKEDHHDAIKKNGNYEGLALGLGSCKFDDPFVSTEQVRHNQNNQSSESSLGRRQQQEEEEEEEESTEVCRPPSKTLKTVRSSGDDDEDLSEQMPSKKARVSVRARCDTPTMNDGCQWRKYGQKIAKGNPCPRAYYRCTASPTCPVRKQVQRCAEDMSILITTYEGNHNHPLPLRATAMASTTSAAASMLQSQSSSSQQGLIGTSVTAPSTSTSFTPNNLDAQNTRPYQYYFPNSSISTHNSHPTITLDLTEPTANNSSYFNRFSNVPKYSSTCLNFSSSPPSSSSSSWKSTSQLTFGALPNYHKNTTFSNGSLNNIVGSQVPQYQEKLYQSYMQMTNHSSTPTHDHHQQSLLAETITAATKAITSNPNFHSALAAALSSFVQNGGAGVPRDNNSGSEEKLDEE